MLRLVYTLFRTFASSFHLEGPSSTLQDHWPRLISALLSSTKGQLTICYSRIYVPYIARALNSCNAAGNPFDIKWKLSTMVRDGLIYYNFPQQKWVANAGALVIHTEFNVDEFAAK